MRSLFVLIGLGLLLLGSPLSAQDTPTRPVEKTRGWPFYSSETWADGRIERDAVFSLYHYSKDKDGHVTWVAPIYYSGSTARDESEWQVLVPFYYWRDGRESNRFWSLPFDRATNTNGVDSWWRVPGFLPLVERQKFAEAEHTRVGIPWVFDVFASSGGPSTKEISALTIAPRRTGGGEFSLFRYSREERLDRTTSQLLPLYYYSRAGSGDSARGSAFLLPLLSYRSWAPESQYNLILPILGGYKYDKRGSSWNALFGALGSGTYDESRWTRIEPIFSYAKTPASSKFHVLHIYGREKDTAHNVSVHRFLDPLGRFENGPGYYRHRLLPFYMAKSQGDESYRMILPFYGHKKTKNDSFTVAFPIYYGQRSEQRALDVVLPVYVRAKQGERTQRVVFPLYYGMRSPTRDLDVVAPFFWRSKTSELRHWTLFPLFSQTERGAEKLRIVLGPLYVGRSSEDEEQLSSHSLLWPLFQYKRSKSERHFHALPLVWDSRRGDERFTLYAPFYLRASDKDHDQHWIVPLWGQFTRKRDDGGARKHSFYGLGSVIRMETKDATGNTEAESLHVLGPVFTRAKEYAPEESTKTSLLWPLVSHESSPSRSHFHALPLAWFTRDDANAHDVLAPLYVRRKEGDESRLWVLPSWYSKRSPKEDSTLLAPFYFDRQRKGETKDSLRLILGNVWVDYQSKDRSDRGVLWPLTRWVRDGEERGFDSLFLFSHRSALKGTKTRLSPLVYRSSGYERASAHRWWHFVSRESGDWGHRTSVGWHFYASRQEQDVKVRSLFFGLWGTRDADTMTSRWVLPFYYQDSDKSPEQQGDGTLMVLPFYYSAVSDGGTSVTRSIVPPFFTRSTNSESQQSRTSVLLGLVSRETGPNRTSTNVFPLWSHFKDGSGERRLNLSVLYSSKTAGADREVGGIWSRDGYWGGQLVRRAKGKNTKTVSLHPFLFSRHENTAEKRSEWNAALHTASGYRNDTSSAFQVLGVVRGAETPQRKHFTTFPFYYAHEEKQRDLKRYEWQQWTNLLYRGKDANETRYSFLTPYLFSFKDGKGADHDFRILHKGIEFRRHGVSREMAVRPFFTYESDPANGYSYLSLLEILYRSEKKGHDRPTKRRLLLFIPLP